MKNHPAPFARAAALLLAAAALPLTPAIAQETAPPADAPAAEASPPDATTSIPPPDAAAPETPAVETEAAPTATRAPVRTTTTRRTETRTTRRVPATVPGPAIPVAVAPVPAPVPVETFPPAATAPLPPPVAQTPPLEVLPEVPPAPTTATVETRDSRDSLLPWLLGGLLLVGALAFFALRRRRRTDVYDERAYEAAPTPVHVAPIAAAVPIAAPVEPAAPAGRPELDLTMRPVRAGVSGDDARVEFELTVGNSGPVAAEDVRISTWMLAAGSSEAESALIVPRDRADTPAVTIGAGESRTMEASVALPTAEVDGDAVLPVVVADARYRLPDGSEGRTSASFAVGVPDGEELAHFGIDNPSGLHEGVVARPLGEPERV
ncbi:MAG TPA: hypothetical protein VFQ67_00485 [Allosphingosinicella sp.]|jgi:hypothetical protein|nr:hypothetical protein [Allosphingosinicella sp.]